MSTEQIRPLAGATAVVTGGSRGIGRAIVRRLTGDGAAVVFSYGHDGDAARETVEEITGAGGTVWAERAELTDLDHIEKLFLAADEHFGPRLDILVNNAGTFLHTPIGSTSEEDFDRQIAVNTKAPFFALQHAAGRMTEGGRIVNISTVTTRWPRREEAVYAASKAALEQVTWIATRELGGRGITVNVVSPGPTDSGAHGMLRGATTDEARAEVARQTPLGALGRPTDIANMVAFLVGPDGGWVTGQNIRVDGGLVW
ncbi:SDR family oxidoreductase [Streptomyces sp. NPDC088789]|uniref:SDR family oxidoreductase n=1 Tax=Streptomyces sp. NPDC088789 TaxID=3365899 RepID=UPI0038246EF9